MTKQRWHDLLRTLRRLVFPARCVGCGTLMEDPGRAPCICADCSPRWLSELTRPCPVCGRGQSGCRCAPHGREATAFLREFRRKPLFGHLAAYDGGIVSDMVLRIKEEADFDTLEHLASAMALLCRALLQEAGIALDAVCISYPPRTKRKEYLAGYDHMERLSRLTAAYLGVPMAKTLVHVGRREQKTLTAEGRAENARSSYRLLPATEEEIRGKCVILMDDIMTTGATMLASALQLEAAGAEALLCVTVARRPNPEKGEETGTPHEGMS